MYATLVHVEPCGIANCPLPEGTMPLGDPLDMNCGFCKIIDVTWRTDCNEYVNARQDLIFRW